MNVSKKKIAPEIVEGHASRVLFAAEMEAALLGVTRYLSKGDTGNALLYLTQIVRDMSLRMATAPAVTFDELCVEMEMEKEKYGL